MREQEMNYVCLLSMSLVKTLVSSTAQRETERPR
jgi:hypothetical protein